MCIVKQFNIAFTGSMYISLSELLFPITAEILDISTHLIDDLLLYVYKKAYCIDYLWNRDRIADIYLY